MQISLSLDLPPIKTAIFFISNIFKDTRLDAEESSYILSYTGTATETGALANIEFSINSEATIGDSSVSVTVKNAFDLSDVFAKKY